MHSRIALLVAALGLTGACSNESSTSPPPDLSAPAGRVMEIQGTVSARPVSSAGQARFLAQGDEIRGEDIIETRADSSILIQLYHNNAEWFLGPEKQRQVSESLAWRAPKSTGKPLLDKAGDTDHTAAAGRQAERQAADTLATARASANEPAPAAAEERSRSASAEGTAVDDTAPSNAGPATGSLSRAPSSGKRRVKTSASHRASQGADKKVATGTRRPAAPPEAELDMDTEAALAESPGGGSATKGGTTLKAKPDTSRMARAIAPQPGSRVAPIMTIEMSTTKLVKSTNNDDAKVIRKLIRLRITDMQTCLGTHKSTTYHAEAQFVVAANGAVSRLTVRSKDKFIGQCIEKNIRNVTFAGVAAGTTVIQRFKLDIR